MKYRFNHIIEYAALRIMAGIANGVPYRVALFLGWIIACVGFLFLQKKMRVIMSRIRQVFGDLYSERDMRKTTWQAWRNLCFNVIESLRTPSVTLDWVKRVTDYHDFHMVLDNMKEGRGVILAVPHMGNWELAGVASQLLGARIMVIVRRQKNPLTNAYLNWMREYAGIEAFQREARSLAGVVHGLKAGKVLAILPDLRAKADFYLVKYLGHDAQIPAGMALFAREAGVPIIPASVTRVGWARHRWKGFEPIWPDMSLDRETDGRRMTQYVMNCFDQAVRANPDQYFWFNSRWVLGEEEKHRKPISGS